MTKAHEWDSRCSEEGEQCRYHARTSPPSPEHYCRITGIHMLDREQHTEPPHWCPYNMYNDGFLVRLVNDAIDHRNKTPSCVITFPKQPKKRTRPRTLGVTQEVYT